MCLHSHVCGYMWGVTYVSPRGWYQLPPSIAPHLKYGGRISHLNLELTSSSSLASQLGLGMSYLHITSPEITSRPPRPPGIYMASREVNVGPSSLQPVLSLTEPSPQASWKFWRVTLILAHCYIVILYTLQWIRFPFHLFYPSLFIYLYIF